MLKQSFFYPSACIHQTCIFVLRRCWASFSRMQVKIEPMRKVLVILFLLKDGLVWKDKKLCVFVILHFYGSNLHSEIFWNLRAPCLGQAWCLKFKKLQFYVSLWFTAVLWFLFVLHWHGWDEISFQTIRFNNNNAFSPETNKVCFRFP